MGKLTGENIGRRMAIVLDDKIISAPVIESQINERGRITLGGGHAIPCSCSRRPRTWWRCCARARCRRR